MMREILNNFTIKSYQLAVKGSAEDIEEIVNQALTQMKKESLGKMPEKKKCYKCGCIDYNDHAISCKTKLEQKGFNDCLSQVKEVIEDLFK